MLTIRLQRAGKRNHSQFRVVLAEKTAHVSKKVAEYLGSYDPHSKNLNIKDSERLNYWISQRVALSPTVHNLFVEKGLLKAEKVKAFNIPKKEEPKAEAAPATPAAAEEPAAETPAAEAAEAPAEAAPEAPQA